MQSIDGGELDARIAAVISDNPNAYGLVAASNAGIPNYYVAVENRFSNKNYDMHLQKKITDCEPDLIILAGFMRILSSRFVEKFLGKILNIHPALLPKYKGLNTHQRALDAGDTKHGATVHIVTADLDDGPILDQIEVTIHSNDTEKSLQARVLACEHLLYPRVIQWFASGLVKFENNALIFDPSIQPIFHE